MDEDSTDSDTSILESDEDFNDVSSDDSNDENDVISEEDMLVLRPRYQNVATLFQDQREFVINGDALLVEVLADCNYDRTCGGQCLHLMYIIELYLLQFTQNGGVICVVFFDDLASIWSTDPEILLARETLRLHLIHNTQLRVITAPHPWHERWLTYIEEKAVTFALTTDGEHLSHIGKQATLARSLFDIQTSFFLGQQLDLAYIAGVKARANVLEAFFVPAGVRYAVHVKENEESMQNEWSDCVAKCDPLPEFTNSRKEQLLLLLSGDGGGGDCNITTMTGAMACAILYMDNELKSQGELVFIKVFLLHLVLLRHIPLEDRAQVVEPEVWSISAYALLAKLQSAMCVVLPVVVDRMGQHGDPNFLPDLIDGRLFTKLLTLAHTQPELFLEKEFSSLVQQEYRHLWDVVLSFLAPDLTQSTPAFPICTLKQLESMMDTSLMIDAPPIPARRADKPPSVLPIDCPLLQEYVGDIYNRMNKADINDPLVRSAVKRGKDFDEIYHWHSGKPLLNDYESQKDSSLKVKMPENLTYREKKRWQRQQTTTANYMQWYSESLSNVKHRRVIVLEKQSHKKSHQSHHGGGGATKKMSKAEILKEENLQKIHAKEQEQERQRWVQCTKEFKQYESIGRYDQIMKEINQFLQKCQVRAIYNIVMMKKIQILKQMWIRRCDDCSRDGKKLNLKPAADVLLSIQTLYGKSGLLTKHEVQVMVNKMNKAERKKLEAEALDDRQKERKFFNGLKDPEKLGKLSAKTLHKLADTVHWLGFPDLATCICPDYNVQPRAERDAKFAVTMTSTRFQLIHLGHNLERDLRTDPDPRVPNFIPDTWQRELLDIVDSNESALIVAPTSSGKTYVSYYCIEKVLRESDDGIVVYVLPTKALVNQVAATIYGTFRKSLPPGKTLHGVFTRDYRLNILNSQVLVTVPQCLEILLLSPNQQTWVSNLKYVIFDEVHCLGMEIGAEVWEHLLMLIPCPFLALSATIQNPHSLRDWLQTGQDIHYAHDKAAGTLRDQVKSNYKVGLVIYGERYADLEKNVFLPVLSPETRDGPIQTGEFVSFHPLYALTRDKLLGMTEFPPEMSFSAYECVQTYDAMMLVWPERQKLQDLNPDVYFGSEICIKRSKVRLYERDLKDELLSWKHEDHLDKMGAVVDAVSCHIDDKTMTHMNALISNSEDDRSDAFLLDHCDQLAAKLQQENKLPALIFSFSRNICENLAQILSHKLKVKEKFLHRLPPVKIVLDTMRDLKENREDDSKKQHKSNVKDKDEAVVQVMSKKVLELQRKLQSSKGAAEKEIAKHLARWHNVNPNQTNSTLDLIGVNPTLPGCSYAVKGAMKVEDLDKIKHRMRYEDQTMLNNMIRYGVSWHHAGANNKVRSSVELLFRNQHVQIVGATSTLALGIHMPCKSVVFAGDSPFLTSLMFRQMSGRSGRRGFDQVGNVYFFGLGEKKIQHLMSSGMSEINGNIPFTATMVLRLYLFTSTSMKKPMALNMALTLLKNPLLVVNKPLLQEQIRHFFIYCSQFLMRQSLLDDNGVPQGLAGLVTHLHYHEPSNLVFVEMLESGTFHKLCSDRKDVGDEDLMMELLVILANLFTPSNERYIHKTAFLRLQKASKNSKIELPSLSTPRLEPFQQLLDAYNRKVSRTFNDYLKLAADIIRENMSHDNKLPLSNVVLPVERIPSPDHGVEQILADSRIQNKVCSSFAALSGHTDDNLLEDSTDLQNTRHGIHCDEDLLPILRLNKADIRGVQFIRNGFLVDFYRHGSKTCIMKDCGMRSGDVFEGLKDFCLTLKAIAVSLSTLGPESDCVVIAFLALKDIYMDKFAHAYYKLDKD